MTEGLVAVGDSLVNARRSWAFLLAEANGWPLTRLSVGGADSAMVLGQVPELESHRYSVGVLSVGANDALGDWSGPAFSANLRTILAAMVKSCDRVLVQTLPADLGRVPGAVDHRAVVAEANSLIVSGAADHPTCSVVRGEDLAGGLMGPDMVHPTDGGQSVIAERAAIALGFTLAPSPTADQAVTFTAAQYAIGTIRWSAFASARRVVRLCRGAGRRLQR